MGPFKSRKVIYGSPSRIPYIAEEICKSFTADKYEVRISSGNEIYITKGGMFKAVWGLRSAMKVSMKPSWDGYIDFEASISIVKQQLIPTPITVYMLSPIVIAQIWSIIRQPKLDEKALEVAENVVYRNNKDISRIYGSYKDYSIYDCGEDMLFLQSRRTKRNLLMDVRNNKVTELTDDNGKMTAFTDMDVSQTVRDQDVNTGNSRSLIADYRFFVHRFRNGQADVEWTICPDGLFFADEDGFGSEDCQELTAKGVINRNGKIIVPFH
jgi:hypothetical protein